MRWDSWENLVTTLGTMADKLTHHKPVLQEQLPDTTLEAMHTSDDLAATIIEKLPSDALRAGFTVSIPATETDDPAATGKAIDAMLQQLGAEHALQQAWVWARLYGFGAVLVGVDDGLPLDMPLDVKRVRSITHLLVLRRPELQPDTYYDDLEQPHFGEVKLYRVLPKSLPNAAVTRRGSLLSGEVLVHESRLLKFRGVPTSRWGTSAAQFWDDSVLQRVYEALREFSSGWMSTAHLLTDASQAVIKLANFMQLVSAAGEDKMRARLRWLNIGRSVARAVVLDERESFERIPTPFAGIPELLDRWMLRLAAAAHMPVTILFGRAPAGLNATGESDTRAWYDQVSTERAKRLTPNLEQLVRIVMAVDAGPTKGIVLEQFCIEYPPLWQPTEKEEAEAFKLEADALTALVNARVILPEEAALILAKRRGMTDIDVETREAALAYGLARLRDPQPEPEPPPQPNPALPQEPQEPDDAPSSPQRAQAAA